MIDLIIIGGHPKGYNCAFHPNTKSGKVLRTILQRNMIDARLMNLWKDQKGEDNGTVSRQKLAEIRDLALDKRCKLVVVGRYMHNQLKRQIAPDVEFYYLPHPASRSKHHMTRLEHGLIALAHHDRAQSTKNWRRRSL